MGQLTTLFTNPLTVPARHACDTTTGCVPSVWSFISRNRLPYTPMYVCARVSVCVCERIRVVMCVCACVEPAHCPRQARVRHDHGLCPIRLILNEPQQVAIHPYVCVCVRVCVPCACASASVTSVRSCVRASHVYSRNECMCPSHGFDAILCMLTPRRTCARWVEKAARSCCLTSERDAGEQPGGGGRRVWGRGDIPNKRALIRPTPAMGDAIPLYRPRICCEARIEENRQSGRRGVSRHEEGRKTRRTS